MIHSRSPEPQPILSKEPIRALTSVCFRMSRLSSVGHAHKKRLHSLMEYFSRRCSTLRHLSWRTKSINSSSKLVPSTASSNDITVRCFLAKRLTTDFTDTFWMKLNLNLLYLAVCENQYAHCIRHWAYAQESVTSRTNAVNAHELQQNIGKWTLR